jgi:hypothetical protein
MASVPLLTRQQQLACTNTCSGSEFRGSYGECSCLGRLELKTMNVTKCNASAVRQKGSCTRLQAALSARALQSACRGRPLECLRQDATNALSTADTGPNAQSAQMLRMRTIIKQAAENSDERFEAPPRMTADGLSVYLIVCVADCLSVCLPLRMLPPGGSTQSIAKSSDLFT